MEVLQVPAELEAAVQLYRERKPERVLEIGCWDGGTLKEWLTQGSPTVVVAVDLEHRNAEAYEEWRDPSTELLLHTGSSQALEQILAMEASSPYDWAFIDGDHGEYGVRTDVQNVMPLMQEGGLMLMHDITPMAGHETNPVRVLFEELSQDYETWAYEYGPRQPWSQGIGVVQL